MSSAALEQTFLARVSVGCHLCSLLLAAAASATFFRSIGSSRRRFLTLLYLSSSGVNQSGVSSGGHVYQHLAVG